MSRLIGDKRAAVRRRAAGEQGGVRKSISPDYLTSFIDGRCDKSLKRHLSSQDLRPSEYRERFGLPNDYSMVVSNYSAQRSQLAKTLGLGRRAAAAPPPNLRLLKRQSKPLRRGPLARARRRGPLRRRPDRSMST